MRESVTNKTRVLAGCVIVWAVLALAGSGWMLHLQGAAASSALTPAARWPIGLNFDRDPSRFTLVMSLHPRCPCSRASLHELEELLSRSGDRLCVHVMFVQPPGAPADWMSGDLWNSASEMRRTMRGVSVSIDQDGRAAAALGASTSGEVFLFDANGILRFHGGITDGRGHEGDNVGLDNVLAILNAGPAASNSSAVFGCPLVGGGGVCQNPRQR